MNNNFSIQQVTWSEACNQLAYIRRKVFIEEQHVPEELEWDNQDKHAVHLLALDEENQPIGCVRMQQNGSIGRMAVVKKWRRRGVGKHLLTQVIFIAKQKGLTRLKLSSQYHAIDFYIRFGFKVYGEQFIDAGIPHQCMELPLNTTCNQTKE